MKYYSFTPLDCKEWRKFELVATTQFLWKPSCINAEFYFPFLSTHVFNETLQLKYRVSKRNGITVVLKNNIKMFDVLVENVELSEPNVKIFCG